MHQPAPPTPSPSSTPLPPPARYEALDALRGVAVLMVVYDHLFAVAGERLADGAFAPVPWVRQWVSGPLGIIQDFGWCGVCLFFLISGFVIAHAGRREPMRVFVLRRLFRIFPPLAAAIAVVALLEHATGTPRPWSQYLQAVTLTGYLNVPQVVVLDVAWTLVIEVLFYALVALLSPLLKSTRPLAALVAGTAVPLGVLGVARDFGASFFLLAASVAYLPVLLMGSALYLRHAGLIGARALVALLLANAAVFLVGLITIHTAFLPFGNSYPLSLVYALVLFIWALGRKAPTALTFVGDVSYSLYLLHGTIGFVAVYGLLALGAAGATPWLAALLCIGVSWVFYRLVERPSMALGRRLAR